MTLKQILFPTATACCATALFFAPVTQVRAADEWEQNTTYYEDDAWYDISEWFDGNDYNPTDESLGRWDDETYDASQDVGTDQNNDRNWGYGYGGSDNDWFYDYYDTNSYSYSPSMNDDTYDYVSRYYDYNNDGKYDAYVSYADMDNDGTYEDFTYLSFANQGKQGQQNQQASNQQQGKENQQQMNQDWQKRQNEAKQSTPQSSKRQQMTGTIQQTKTVKVRGGQHTVAQIQADGKNVNVDLGPTDKIQSLNLEKGSQIQVTGPMIKVGDKQIVQAKQVTLNGKTQDIQPARRTLNGNVTAVHTAKVRGKTNQIAIIETQDAGKVAVDLGPKDQLDVDVQKGSQVSVTGMPVKIQNRQVLFAQSIKGPEGKTMWISRSSSQKDGTASAQE